MSLSRQSIRRIAALLAGAIFVWALMPFLPDPARAFPAPHAPILSFSPADGFDSTDAIKPDTAPAGSELTFSVVYTHPDNHPPVFALPVLFQRGIFLTALAHEDNGEEEGMKLFVSTAPGSPFYTERRMYRDAAADPDYPLLHDGNYANGEQFSLTIPGGLPLAGIYAYYFEVTDGEWGHWRYLDETLQGDPLTFTLTPPPPPPPPARNPVILIPGISGSELFHNGEEIWMNIGKMVTDFGDEFLDVLAMDEQGQSVEDIEVGDIIREKSIYDIWVNMIEDFESAGYSENQDLFVFPYDWRQDNREIADRLKGLISLVLQQASSQKVDLIVHSMGGLVAKQYLTQHGESSVDQLVFVGTPHYGAPKALKVLLYGDQFGIPGILDPKALKRVAHNMSSVYQLLPSLLYVEDQETYFIDWADIDGDGVTGRLDFSQTQALIGNFDLNTQLRDDAHALHTSLDSWIPSPDLQPRTHNIIGCGVGTPGTFISFNDNGKKTVLLRTVGGDETVPLHSARKVAASGVYYIPGATHARMPDNALIRHLVLDILDDNTVDLLDDEYEDIRQGVGNCDYTATAHSVHSPINLHAYDTSGNHTGPNPQGGIDEEIPSSTYTVLGEDKFLFLPKGLDVTISLEGTDDGTFRYDLTEVNQDGELGSTRFFDLPVTPQTKGEILFNENDITDAIIKLDQEGDGHFEQTFTPSSILDPAGAADFIPPVISFTNPGLDAIFEHHVVIALEGSITDDTAPISAIIGLDGNTVDEQSAPASPLVLSHSLVLPTVSLGTHSVSVNAHDAAGNYVSVSKTFTVIATPASVLGLIDWGKDHGWYRGPLAYKLLKNLADKLLSLVDQLSPLPPKVSKRAKITVLDAFTKLLERLHKQGMIMDEGYEVLKEEVENIKGQL